MAMAVAALTREQVNTRGPRALSKRPNARCAQGLPVERCGVAADIARVERRGYRASDAG
jgi:hypothetical protein